MVRHLMYLTVNIISGKIMVLNKWLQKLELHAVYSSWRTSAQGGIKNKKQKKKQTRQIYAVKQAGRHTRTIKLAEAN